jgi:hypothetical protein
MLHQLPGELLLEVSDGLDAVDIASLHLSYRKHCILLRSKVRRSTNKVTKGVKTRLKRDRFRILAGQEARDITGSKELLCSFCRDAHPRSFFLEDKLANSPFERRCIGSVDTFYIRTHLSCTSTQINEIIVSAWHLCSLSTL